MTQENPLWMQNNAYSARLDRQMISAMWSEGVINGLAVSQRGAGANMSVDIAVGRAVIAGDDQVNQGSYLSICTALENIAIGAAPGSNSRIDVVFMRINDPNALGPAGNNSAFGVVAGTAAASPVAPATPTSAIALAQVLVATGTVAITTAMITDVRDQSLVTGQLPPGSIIDYVGGTVPSGFLLAAGQSFDGALYFGLKRALGGTTLPDLRGRVAVGLDNMNGTDAGRVSVANTLLGTGGAEKVGLILAELAAHTHTMAQHTHTIDHDHSSFTSGLNSVDHTHTFSGTASTSASHTHGLGTFGVISQIIAGAGPYIEVEAVADGNDIDWANLMDTEAGGSHNHTYSGTTAANNADHSHAIDVPAFAGSSGTGGATDTGSTGSGTPHENMMPYILVNKLIKT